MADRTPDSEFWKAVADNVGDECLLFTPEELALYAEKRLPERQAKVIRRHLEVCDACRELVTDLTREVFPAPAVRFRPAPARGWQIAFATVAAALLVTVVLTHLPRTPQSPALPGPSPSTVAQQPSEPLAPTTPPETPTVASTAPKPPAARPAATQPSVARQPARRPQRRQAIQPRQMLAHATPRFNDVQLPASLALFEPGDVTAPCTEDPLALEREGLANTLYAPPLPALSQAVTTQECERP